MENVNDGRNGSPPGYVRPNRKNPLHEEQDVSLREDEWQWRMVSGKCGSVHNIVMERVE